VRRIARERIRLVESPPADLRLTNAARCPVWRADPVYLVAVKTILCIALFTLLSGVGDAWGFLHAGKAWNGAEFQWLEALKSAAGFQFGVLMYWLALRHLQASGVVAVEIQTLFWFGATIIGVALLSGQFLRWPLADQLAAGGVLSGIGWLMFRTAQ
jgi:hypothetical protein